MSPSPNSERVGSWKGMRVCKNAARPLMQHVRSIFLFGDWRTLQVSLSCTYGESFTYRQYLLCRCPFWLTATKKGSSPFADETFYPGIFQMKRCETVGKTDRPSIQFSRTQVLGDDLETIISGLFKEHEAFAARFPAQNVRFRPVRGSDRAAASGAVSGS